MKFRFPRVEKKGRKSFEGLLVARMAGPESNSIFSKLYNVDLDA